MIGFKITAATLQFKNYPMKTILLAACLFIAYASHAQELQKYYSEAMAAYKAKDYPQFYEKIKEANKIHPYHQGVLYQLGIAATLTGKKSEAIQNLKKAILINTDFKLEGIADFNSIKDSPAKPCCSF